MSRTRDWDSVNARSAVTRRQSRGQVKKLSKSELERWRRTHHTSTTPPPALNTQKPLRKMRGLGPAGRVTREGPGDFRYVGNVAIYRSRLNGIPNTGPEMIPYVWGESRRRNTRSFRNLDLAAIAAADWMADPRRKGGPGNLDVRARAEILKLHAENPAMPFLDIANIVGVSPGLVSRTLRSIRLPGPEPLEPGRCTDCGYMLTSTGHRLTCLRDVPDAEPEEPVLKLRPEDRIRIGS